jgi:CheY-like chemotaxis protein
MPETSSGPVLVCATSHRLRTGLEASLSECGYVVAAAATQDEALAALREQDHAAVIVEARRDSFARFLKVAAQLRPRMPVHVIDGDALFCFYPLARQPRRLMDAVRAAGVKISPYLLRHACEGYEQAADAFMV